MNKFKYLMLALLLLLLSCGPAIKEDECYLVRIDKDDGQEIKEVECE